MATPKLTQLRQDIKDHLVTNTSLNDDQIIIIRDKNAWDTITSAVSLATNGLAVHISESSGQNSNLEQVGNRKYDVNMVITIFSNYNLPDSLDNEEIVFEELVLAMNTFATKLFGNSQICIAGATLLSWTNIPNDFEYYARAMTYQFPIVFNS
jgi:hypothetical protein